MMTAMNTTTVTRHNRARRHTVVGVMGGASASPELLDMAREVGELIARRGWTLLTGGRTGIMEAASRGACMAGGLVIGMLPGDDPQQANPFVHIALPTGIGNARNAVNVTACRGIIAIGGQAGTLSEIALALKAFRPVVGLHSCSFGYAEDRDEPRYHTARSPREAVETLAGLLHRDEEGQEDRP